MAIKILGGLSIDNLVSTDSKVRRRVEIQQTLYEEKFTEGIQLRVGHDYTNKADINLLSKELGKLGLPFLAHAAAENWGVDFGECFDECGIFEKYKADNPKARWYEFNQQAVSNALKIASSPNSLSERAVIHPGYTAFLSYCSRSSSYVQSLEKVKEIISKNVRSLLFEAVPALVIDENKGNISHYGYGAIPEEMKELLGSSSNEYQQVLIDFSHVEITANQMARAPSLFSAVKTYQSLLEEFLQMNGSRFTHFSGPTDKLQDDHDGFLGKCGRNPIVVNALQEIKRKFSPNKEEVYVALEINFSELETSKREIERFRKDYTL